MKLGFVSAILPELSLEQVLAFARDEGFECIEAMCWPVGKAERKYAGVTHVNVTGFTQTQAEDMNALCAKYGVNLSALGYYPNPLDPNPDVAKKAVDHLKRVLVAAEKLGLKNVNTFVGRDWTRSVEDNWPRFLKVWKPLVAFAEDYRIKIGIENCPMLFSNDEWPGGKNLAMCPAIWRRIFADIPSDYFGLNYDPSHPVLLRMDYLKPLKEFAGKLFHIHAKAGPVIAIEVEAGDLIRVPRGTWHWFNLCADRRIRAIRLFQDMAGWTPLYTESGVDQSFLPVCFSESKTEQ